MKNKEKSFVSAVVYVYNSEERIESFLRTLIGLLEDNFENSEIIVVNDHSNDNSVSVIKRISSDTKKLNLTLVNMSYFHGLELAMNAGTDLSIGDFVLEFDSTYIDYDPDMIMSVYYRALEGYDMVSASPNCKEKFSSSLFYKVFNIYSSTETKMQTESFRVLSRRIINRVSSDNKTVPYRKALYLTSGLKTDTIKYEVTTNAKHGFDNVERKHRSTLAIDSIITFTDLGFRFSKAMSLLMIFITVFTLIYTFVAFVISNPVEGWTSTILFLSVAFFGLFVILTIIIKYLQILVGLVFKRRNYSYESIEKLTK